MILFNFGLEVTSLFHIPKQLMYLILELKLCLILVLFVIVFEV